MSSTTPPSRTDLCWGGNRGTLRDAHLSLTGLLPILIPVEGSLALPSESDWESVGDTSPSTLVMVKTTGLLTSLAVTATGRVLRRSTGLSKTASTPFLSNSALSFSSFKESFPGEDFAEPYFGVVVSECLRNPDFSVVVSEFLRDPEFGIIASEFLRDPDLSDDIRGADEVTGFSDLCFSSDLAICSLDNFAADSFEEDSFAAANVASKF